MPRYNEQSQQLILNVLRFFEEERERVKNGLPIISPLNVICRASLALNVSEPTICKLKKNNVQHDSLFRKNMSEKVKEAKTKVNDIVRDSIRDVIYKMYAAKESVTMKSLHKRLVEESGGDFPYSISSINRWSKEIGFKWKQSDNRLHPMEQPNIQLKRTRFLREYVDNLKSISPLQCVFLDETWIFSKGSFRKSWQDNTLATSSKKSGEGYRYIVLHAGTADGFVENSNLVFKSGTQKGDYHTSMNRQNFERWFKTQFVPNLKRKSLIIMDNASYHSGLEEENPTKSWTKQKLISWLKLKNIDFPEKSMKDQIWSIVAMNKPLIKKYHLDEYVKQFGHKILRIPPYHCQYNAIEMVWSVCKRKYDEQIVSTHSTPDEIIETWNKVLKEVNAESWKKYVQHVENLIKESWETAKQWDTSDIEPLIINIELEDTTDDSNTDDDFDEDYNF